MHSKQGVFLLSYQNKSSIGDNGSIDLEVVFEASEGDLKFKIKWMTFFLFNVWCYLSKL